MVLNPKVAEKQNKRCLHWKHNRSVNRFLASVFTRCRSFSSGARKIQRNNHEERLAWNTARQSDSAVFVHLGIRALIVLQSMLTCSMYLEMKKETYRCRILEILDLLNLMPMIVVSGFGLFICRRVRLCCCHVGHRKIVQPSRLHQDSAILLKNSFFSRLVERWLNGKWEFCMSISLSLLKLACLFRY